MRGPTLPFASTKAHGPISIDLREKQKKIFFLLSLSLSLLALILLRFSFFSFDFPSFYFFSYFLFFSFIFILFYFYFFLILSFPLFPILDTWLNVSYSHKCTTCHSMCHPTLNASKNVKFRLSWNPMKFDRLTRFHETNSRVKSVSSSKI